MITVAQGATYTFHSTFRVATGELVDPDANTVFVDVLASDGAVIVEQDVPVRTSLGMFEYQFTVPDAAFLGEWQIKWYGGHNGTLVSSFETFQVVAAGTVITTASIVERIRRMLGERIPLGKVDTDTRFTDLEITDTYYINAEDINKTLAELWLAKAAYLGDFVDISESGTTRSLSQMQKAALAQANTWANRASVYDQAWASTYRVMARSFSPYCADKTGDRIRSGAVIIVPEDPQRLWSGTGI